MALTRITSLVFMIFLGLEEQEVEEYYMFDWIKKEFGKEIKNKSLITGIEQKTFAEEIAKYVSLGCVGVVWASLGNKNLDLSKCYGTFEEAKAKQQKMNLNCECKGLINMKGEESSARIFGLHTSDRILLDGSKRSFTQKKDGTYHVDSAVSANSEGIGAGNYDFVLVSKDYKTVSGANHANFKFIQKMLKENQQKIPPFVEDAAKEDDPQIIYTNLPREKWILGDYNREFWCVACEHNNIYPEISFLYPLSLS